MTKSYVPDKPHDAADALSPHDVGGAGGVQAGKENYQQTAGAVHCEEGGRGLTGGYRHCFVSWTRAPSAEQV